MACDRDLCDVVPELRRLNWSAAFAGFTKLPHAWPERDRPSGVEAPVAKLGALADQHAKELASCYRQVAANSEPSRGSRTRTGLSPASSKAIGDCIVMAVLDIDHTGLNELCRRHGAAPFSGAQSRPPATNPVVVRDRNVMAGRAVFRGTLLPVEVLFENLADGLSLSEILDAHKALERADRKVALAQACAALIAAASGVSDRSP